MFEDLDDPAPLVPGPGHRRDVASRARRITAARRTRRYRLTGVGLVVIAAVGISADIGVRSSNVPTAGRAVSSPHHRGGPPGESLGPPKPQASAGATSGATPTNSSLRLAAGGGAASNGCVPEAACPPPVFVGGKFSGAMPHDGSGRGTHGECVGTETTAPCAPGVVVGRFYAMTIPSGCGQPIRFDGRRWWSTHLSVLGAKGSTADAWLQLDGHGEVDVVAPFGALTLSPASGHRPTNCVPFEP